MTNHIQPNETMRSESSARNATALARLLATTVTLLGLTVCVSGCDSGFRAQGELVVQGQTAPSCRMRLHDASKGAVLHDRSVHGSFDELFTISRFPSDYYLTITCDGVPQSFKSATFRAGSGRYYDPPLKLGKIVLSKEIKPD